MDLGLRAKYGQIHMKLGLTRQISEKYSDQIHETPSIVSQIIPCGQKDRHDGANSHLSQFCKRA